MFCFLVATIADGGHRTVPLEPPAHSVVDTTRETPTGLNMMIDGH